MCAPQTASRTLAPGTATCRFGGVLFERAERQLLGPVDLVGEASNPASLKAGAASVTPKETVFRSQPEWRSPPDRGSEIGVVAKIAVPPVGSAWTSAMVW
jgi:hypothetical protein